VRHAAEADFEWRVALEALTPEQRTQAVRLASQWGWHLQAIAAAARLGLFNDYELLYPRPSIPRCAGRRSRAACRPRSSTRSSARRACSGVDAASGAGALGLMQLLPATAQATARKAGLPSPSRSELLQPSVNIPLGSAFLSDLIERADGQVPLAVAGYNAGPPRPGAGCPPRRSNWTRGRDIPFNETRAYVQRVHWHALVFDWLEDRKPREAPWTSGSIRRPGGTGAVGPGHPARSGGLAVVSLAGRILCPGLMHAARGRVAQVAPGCSGPMRYGRIISLSSCSTMWQCQTYWPGLSKRIATRVTCPG